jgi:hypothetical protein
VTNFVYTFGHSYLQALIEHLDLRAGRAVIAVALPFPNEELGKAIDLIVMLSMRKCSHLKQELFNPGTFFLGDQDLSAFNHVSYRQEAHLLVGIGLTSDKGSTRGAIPREIRLQGQSKAILLEKHRASAVICRMVDDLSAQVWKLLSYPQDVGQIIVPTDRPKCLADGIVVLLADTESDVPALEGPSHPAVTRPFATRLRPHRPCPCRARPKCRRRRSHRSSCRLG